MLLTKALLLVAMPSWVAAQDWAKYVRAPQGKVVRPVRIRDEFQSGDVRNPHGIVDGSGPTILHRSYDQGPAWIMVDFGQTYTGYLKIDFGGATAFKSPGQPGIRLSFSESIQYGYMAGDNLSDFTRAYSEDNQPHSTPGSDQIAVQSQPYTWTNAHGCQHDGNKVCADGLHGFRYVKISIDAIGQDYPYTTTDGEVRINSISLEPHGFHGTPDTFTGNFQCSDEALTQYWYDGVYTNDLCTDTLDEFSTDPRGAASPSILNKLVLLDGAKRDRLPYTGDLGVASRTSYVSHNVSDATRNVLADMADHQRSDGWIPPASIRDYTLPLIDYSLWWVIATYDMYMYTADTNFVTKYYQVMVNTLDKFYPGITDPSTKLVTKGYANSGGYGDYAFIGRSGPVTYYNALYVKALKNAAAIATNLNKPSDASRWLSRAGDVSKAINDHNFDNGAGAFYDGKCGDNYCQTHAQDGNSMNIVSGAVTGSRALSSLAFLSAHNRRDYGNAFYDNGVIDGSYGDRVYAFTSYFEIEARFLTGQGETAVELMKRMYGHMATNDPRITMWEGIGAGGTPYEGGFTSLAHGWSTGITPALTNHILGVTPSGPGFSTFNLKPRPSGLTWAKGAVDTPHGPIHVSWTISGSQFTLTFDCPTGTDAIVSVPVKSRNSSVLVKNNLVWQNGSKGGSSAAYEASTAGDGYVRQELKSGSFTVVVRN